jgi:basic membrane protein A and related proteins
MINRRISRRSLVAGSLAAPIAASLPLGVRLAGAQDAIVATMVTDTAGLGDQNFNDLANLGGTTAAEEFGIEWRVIESIDATAYIPNLTAGAEQGDLTIGVGFLLTEAITAVAQQFPDHNFQLIDAVSEEPNVQSVLFREQEASFLIGVVSGLMTQTNQLGIVGGQRIPPVIRYEVGFIAGVQSVNPDATVNVNYADSFSDPALGKELALAQFNQGADIVFPIAGLTGVGCYEAVRELGNEGEQWVLGADTDQSHLAPGYQLAVAQKGVDFAVYRACEQVVAGEFEPGINDLGLAEGGVSLQTPEDHVPDDVLNIAAAYEEMILDGTLVVPTTDDELAAFEAPEMPEGVGTPDATPSA